MKKFFPLWLLVFFHAFAAEAQAGLADSSYLISLNQQIDNAVVKQDTISLKKWYAADFVFSHGSGRVDGKESWLTSVTKGNFISRQHDSVTVELHPTLAVVKGKLAIQKKNADKIDRYHLKYIRVYAYRNKEWQLASHNTTYEYHEPLQ
jgi:hypothetical protein